MVKIFLLCYAHNGICQGYFFEFDPAKDTVIPLFKDNVLIESNYIHFAEEDQYMYFRYEAQLMRWKLLP